MECRAVSKLDQEKHAKACSGTPITSRAQAAYCGAAEFNFIGGHDPSL
jgi:hypothetical protein